MEQNNDQIMPDFVSYKKVLLFGDQSTGKSSFTERLQKNKFIEDIVSTKESK